MAKINYNDILECYILYVEYHMSLREVSKELLISHQQVKNRLDMLADINDEMFQSYKLERRNKKRGKKKQNI